MISQQRSRSGYTLIEMIVATALCLFIMAIISTAFRHGLDTFSKMRAIGKLQDNLRTASQVIRADLGSEHFQGPFRAGFSGPHLGDQRADRIGWTPPLIGYFHMRQCRISASETQNANGTGPVVSDGEGLISSISPPLPTAATPLVSHMISMTVRMKGSQASELFCAAAPGTNGEFGSGAAVTNGLLARMQQLNALPSSTPPQGNTTNGIGQFYSEWAEVYYYLRPTGATTEPDAAGLTKPLFNLCRRIRVLAPVGTPLILDNVAANLDLRYPELSLTRTGPNTFRFNTAADVCLPQNRLPLVNLGSGCIGVAPLGVSPGPVPVDMTGTEILMANVTSFEVKAGWLNNGSFNQLVPFSPAMASLPANQDYPFDNLPATPPTLASGRWITPFPAGPPHRVFDTWYRSGDQNLTASPINPTNDNGYAPSAGSTVLSRPDLQVDWDAPVFQNGGVGAVPNPQSFLAPTAAGGISNRPPLRISVRGLQIRLRIWDMKSKQSRQVTIVQEV